MFVHCSGSFDDVKVHLAMAPDAVVLNLHTDALELYKQGVASSVEGGEMPLLMTERTAMGERQSH